MSETNKSTGPTTPEGKAISSQNALKHGLASRRLFIPGEDPSAFEELLRSFKLDFKPDGPVEDDLVEEICMAKWLKERAIRMQTLAFEKMAESDDPYGIPPNLHVFIRYQITNENRYLRALRALQAIQKEKKRDDQFVWFTENASYGKKTWEPRDVVHYINRANFGRPDSVCSPPETSPL
jgi:hypothetical protein